MELFISKAGLDQSSHSLIPTARQRSCRKKKKKILQLFSLPYGTSKILRAVG